LVDHLKSIGLCERALEISILSLKIGGSFFCKAFQGGAFQDFVNSCKKYFKNVRIVKPKGSRSESVEIFVFGQGFKRPLSENTID
jgi:23S rRNA (uridine2552-2'-O)-methyltransferase